jgi:uncharacterized protein (DUF1800 family)
MIKNRTGRAAEAVLLFLVAAVLDRQACLATLDTNSNQQSDVWELRYGASGLGAAGDADGDGVLNGGESIAGTDPFNPLSVPEVSLRETPAQRVMEWSTLTGKQYIVEVSTNLFTGPWLTNAIIAGNGALRSNVVIAAGATALFHRVVIRDLDSDGDQLTDWEEMQLGYQHLSDHSDRYALTDYQRISLGLLATNSVVSVGLRDGEIYERWPDPGVIAIRRTNSTRQVTIHYTLGGTAARNTDYTTPTNNAIVMPIGAREVWVEFWPVADTDDAEATETITLTLAPGPGYTLGTNVTASVNLVNETTNSLPNPKAAARFLVQAAFGPDADAAADPDIIPENVEEVMAMGFEAWIDDQFARPVGTLQPFVEWSQDTNNVQEFWTDSKEAAWWNRAMGLTNLYPGGPVVAPDPLRQRVAFALSQIMVISDRLEALGVDPVGMANYYDMLLTNAFGSYRQLLYDVSMHPCMGLYLSHLMNRKADPVNNIFPDENYAREVMQLFSIGLWELNTDGTRKLTNGLPIPTYDNGDITEFARVFTGLSWGGTNATSFWNWDWVTTEPMKAWDEYHDCDAKTLLNGETLPARTPSNPDTGAAALLDLNAAMDNLFNHPNVGPFIGYRLIQRFVTSNPSTGYIARVAAAFNNNGSNVRGDMKAVIKAVLLDPEARDPAKMFDPTFGKQREPYLRVVNFGRAFNARANVDFYPLDNFYMDHYEEPLSSPSVFNFYLPTYSPPGAVHDAGLVGPEFQILNASSAISTANYYDNAIRYGLHRWGNGDSNRVVRCDTSQELALVNDVDGLLRRLDLALTYGSLSPREFQAIKEALERINSTFHGSNYANERLYLAIYAIVTSPEFCVMR